MKLNQLLVMVGMVILSACGQNKKQSAAPVEQQQTAGQTESQFPFPEIPAMMTDPGERLNYLFVHYWDNYDFQDTTLLHNRMVTEQGFANQLALLAQQSVNQTILEQGINNLCRKMESNEASRKVFMKLFDDYLENANSPYYNEDLYLIYLRSMLKSSILDEAHKSTLNFKLRLINQNMPETLANDFTYYLPDGLRRTLRTTSVKNNRLILLFYDPECPNCHRILEAMKSDEQLAEAIAKGSLTLLAVYTEGDEAHWKRALPEMPKGWIVGSDRESIKTNATYDLKAMPSLYLLDGKYKVLLKDRPYDMIRQYLGWGTQETSTLTLTN